MAPRPPSRAKKAPYRSMRVTRASVWLLTAWLLAGCDQALGPAARPPDDDAPATTLLASVGKETLLDLSGGFPAIDGDRIVWVPSVINEVRVVNLATGAVTGFGFGRRTFKTTPSISDVRVVWQEDRPASPGGFSVTPNIMLGDLATGGESQITHYGSSSSNPSRQELEPRISGGLVVWQDVSALDLAGDIYMYDIVTGTTTAVATGPSLQRDPAVSGNRIVWVDDRERLPPPSFFRFDIFMLDALTGEERRITPLTRLANARFPAISGDRIVWQEARDVFVFDLTTSSETRILAPGTQERPAIWQHRVVWQDDRNGNWDIYLYDVLTAQETRITTNTADQIEPSISGNRITWSDLRNGGIDACYFEIDAVAPALPTAAPGGPYSGPEGSVLRVTDGGSMSADCSRLSRRWDLGDGTVIVNVLSMDHRYVDNGVYNVSLTVTDVEGRTHTRSTTATIANVAPRIDARLFPAEAATGTSYTVSAGFFDPGRLDQLVVTIDFGDGGGAQPVSYQTTSGTFHHFEVSHTYVEAGTYTVIALITDKDGASATIRQEVVVKRSNSPPVAVAGGPYVVAEGSTLVLSLSGSDPDGNPLSYTWGLGDGTTGTGPTPPASHIYADNGEYTISLTVDDGAGDSDTKTTTASVTNVAPAVNAIPGAMLIQRETYSAPGSFSDPGTDSWGATVDYGFGAGVKPLALVNKTFALRSQYRTPGSYTVGVAVTDDEGDVGRGQASVAVLSFRDAIHHLLILTVDELVAAGRVSESQGTQLKAKVQAILDRFASVDLALYPTQLTLALRGYIAYVKSLVTLGKVPAAAGEALIQNAERIIRAINTP